MGWLWGPEKSLCGEPQESFTTLKFPVIGRMHKTCSVTSGLCTGPLGGSNIEKLMPSRTALSSEAGQKTCGNGVSISIKHEKNG